MRKSSTPAALSKLNAAAIAEPDIFSGLEFTEMVGDGTADVVTAPSSAPAVRWSAP